MGKLGDAMVSEFAKMFEYKQIKQFRCHCFFATSMAVETRFLTYKAKKILQFPPKSKNKGSKNYLKPHLRLNSMFVRKTIKT
jgi:hypothetical protein